jgi:hypothetical protein
MTNDLKNLKDAILDDRSGSKLLVPNARKVSVKSMPLTHDICNYDAL